MDCIVLNIEAYDALTSLLIYSIVHVGVIACSIPNPISIRIEPMINVIKLSPRINNAKPTALTISPTIDT